MRKPFQTDSVSDKQPNEPKMYPGQQDFNKSAGGDNMEGFAEKAPIKAQDQLNHISVPIASEHIFGKASPDPKAVHMTPNMASSAKMPSFANSEKIPGLKKSKI